MPSLKRMMHLARSAERLSRRLRDSSLSWELYGRLCAQHHLLQRRLYAISGPSRTLSAGPPPRPIRPKSGAGA